MLLCISFWIRLNCFSREDEGRSPTAPPIAREDGKGRILASPKSVVFARSGAVSGTTTQSSFPSSRAFSEAIQKCGGTINFSGLFDHPLGVASSLLEVASRRDGRGSLKNKKARF